MVEPLPWWAKVFMAVVGVAIVVLVITRLLDDGGDDALPADWRVAPSAALDRQDREIPIVVHERACASGRSAEGRIRAEVTYGDDTVGIDVGVRPMGGDQECPSNPDTPFVVELDQPLGDRRVTGERWSP